MCVGDKLFFFYFFPFPFFFPSQIKKTLTWGLCYSQTENYCCGYKEIIFTVSFNLMTFFFNPFYINISIFMFKQ